MKKIIIIGAGIAGLSAGVYAQKNGYDATIYELHYLPGGMCTAWQRNGFMFEGCMHFLGLVGSSPTHMYYHLWNELGALPKIKIYNYDIYHTYRDASGRTLNIYVDADELEQELLNLSPTDAEQIKALCTAIRRYTSYIKSANKNPFRFLSKIVGIIRGIPLLKKYGEMSIGEFASQFKDPLIRYALTNFVIYPDFSCISIFFFLAGMHIKGTGYPEGSSLAFARSIEHTFLELNGKIEYKKKVKQIVVENGQAKGIELDDGTTIEADLIISAADGYNTLYEMLDDKYTTPALRQRYKSQPVFPPFIQVSLGVSRDLSGTPHSVNVQTSEPFEIAGEKRHALWYQNYAFDPTAAPEGKTSLTVLYPSNLSWWEQLGYPSNEYTEEKEKVLKTTISQLERILPGISEQIETSDVATPITMVRYTNNWQGALSFMMTKDIAAEMFMKTQYTLPGLKNFYMIGQWVKGLGVPVAALSGKEVIQKISKDHGKRSHKR
ncbi:MAG: phytoene desaturase family protein [Candidatus Thorarchaeota archaeon]